MAISAITMALLAGNLVQDIPPAPVTAGNEAFLPDDSELAVADAAIEESFPAAAGVELVQIVTRGDILAPEPLQAIKDLQTAIIGDPEVAPFVSADPLFGYVQIIEALLAADEDFTTVSRADIGTGLDVVARTPALAEAKAGLDRFVPRDAAGDPLAGLSLISPNESGDPLGLEAAQLRAHEIARSADAGGLEVSLFSVAKAGADSEDSRTSSTLLLMILAMAVIIILLAVFYRTGWDVILAVNGLFITIAWTFGALAWLSPGGAGIIEPENNLIPLVPVLLIGLCVDYALQITGRYREDLRRGAVEGEDAPGRAVYAAVRLSAVPVLLASITTAASFLTNLTSKFEPVADFGIITGIGVLSGWIVMTNYVPACRVWLDRRNVAKGRPLATRAVAETIPGAGPLLSRTAAAIVRRPIPILAGALVVTILAAVAATGLNTSFDLKDFLPRGSETADSVELLEENFDGGESTMTVLIESDLNTVRTVRNLHDFQQVLANPQTRPAGIAGPPIASAAALLEDWRTNSGQAGDNYDPELVAALEGSHLGIFAPDEDLAPA